MPEVDGWWDEPAVLFASVLLCLLGRWLALELMAGRNCCGCAAEPQLEVGCQTHCWPHVGFRRLVSLAGWDGCTSTVVEEAGRPQTCRVRALQPGRDWLHEDLGHNGKAHLEV